jgi:hypothetical protein
MSTSKENLESGPPTGKRESAKPSPALSNGGPQGAAAKSGAGSTSSNKQQSRLPKDAGYLNKSPAAVRPMLKRATDIRTFREAVENLSEAEKLSPDERQQVVDQALVLLEHYYVHLPLKRAIHAVDPVQRLKLLKFQLAEMPPEMRPSEAQFHNEMIGIFNSVRDYHTRYSLPSPYNARVAILPFMVEEYFLLNGDRNGDRRKYLVSHMLKGFSHPTFEVGVELLYWNGVPIERAIELNGENQPGSNPAARFACGLDALTIRPLDSSLPPDEEWVTITYRSLDGKKLELRKLKWLIISPDDDEEEEAAAEAVARKTHTKLSINFHKASINQARKMLFKPEAVKAQKEIKEGKIEDYQPVLKDIEAGMKIVHCGVRMPTVFDAKEVQTKLGTFRCIRIYNFEPPKNNVKRFVAEFQRLLELPSPLFKSPTPPDGLIIDVRNNGGGFVSAGERLLQMLTPGEIEPETFEFINTPLNLSICRTVSKDDDLQPWIDSIARSVQTGATYSDGFSLTPKEECNDIKQKFFGPVVLITDALCYSTTDIFAAGFQDHEIGVILGTGGSTGAGGANVWGHDYLCKLMKKQKRSPLQRLPKGVTMRVAMRRSRRIGERGGTPLEEFGVVPDKLHYMSRADLLNDNIDLIKNALTILSRLSAVEYSIDESGILSATVEVRDATRVEYIVGGKKKSLDVQDNKVQFSEPVSLLVPPILQLRAFKRVKNKERLVAVRNIGIKPKQEIPTMKGASEMASTPKKLASKVQPGSPGLSDKNGPSKKKKGTSKKKATSKSESGSKGGAGSTISSKFDTGSITFSKKPTSKKATSKANSAAKSGPGSTSSSKKPTSKKTTGTGTSASKGGAGGTISSKSGPGSQSSNKKKKR